MAPPAKECVQNGRDRSQNKRGKPQIVHSLGDHEKCYAFLCRLDSRAFDTIITYIFPFYNPRTLVVFDPGSNFSYMSYFALGFDMVCEYLIIPICVSILVDGSLMVDQSYKSCIMTLLRYGTGVDLIILDIVDCDAIFSMDILF